MTISKIIVPRLATTFLFLILFAPTFVAFTNANLVSPNQSPVIDSVSPITATLMQSIVIRGSGFGDTQPELNTLSDGSVVTQVGDTTPVLRIYDEQGFYSWEAGCQDSQWVPGGLVGVYLKTWSDNEIVLGGFGTDLNVTGQRPHNIAVGDPLIVNVQTVNGQAAYTTVVVSSQSGSNPVGAPPVIYSVSPISATQPQNITIHGINFGDTQPELLSLSDGSVDTIGGGSTPVMRIYDQNGLESWQAGVQDNPCSGADTIGILLISWSDTEIVLGGFGATVNSYGISDGNPLLIDILTSNGQATYTTIVSNQTGQNLAQTPALSVSCQSSTTISNFRVNINGNLTCNDVGLPGFPVLLSFSVDGGNLWSQLTLVETDSNGDFSAVWLPLVTGNYLLKAEWIGDADYNQTSTIVSFELSPSSEQNVFSVESNSTISAFAFNSTSQELDFVVSGPSGTTGYTNVGIPKSFIGDVSNVNVYIDGKQAEYTYCSQGDSWLLTFTYHHSSHHVTLDLNNAHFGTVDIIQVLQGVTYRLIISLSVIIVLLFVLKKKHVRIQSRKQINETRFRHVSKRD